MAKEFFQQIRLMAESILLACTLLGARVSLEELWARLQLLAYIVAFTWVLFTVNALLLNKALNKWGIRPHTLRGLFCMPLAVFLHGNLAHIQGNTEGFLVFGGRLLILKGIQTFTLVSLVVFLTDGLGTWLFGNEKSNHYGASGMVLVLQTLSFATWGVGGFAPKKGFHPFTPYKTFVLLYSVILAFYFYEATLSGMLHQRCYPCSWRLSSSPIWQI